MDTSLLSKPHVHAAIPGVSKTGYTYLKLKQQVLVLFKRRARENIKVFLTQFTNLTDSFQAKHILIIYMFLTD